MAFAGQHTHRHAFTHTRTGSSRDIAVVRVITMLPPFLYCAAMIAGAASEGVAMALLRYVLGPSCVLATACMVWLIATYEGSPQKDFHVPLVVFGGSLLNCPSGFATGPVAYVLVPTGRSSRPVGTAETAQAAGRDPRLTIRPRHRAGPACCTQQAVAAPTASRGRCVGPLWDVGVGQEQNRQPS
ncbi:hypothetical protein GCM10010267_61550 [Streptomyces griseorubens]|jgi:hypothetical protein|nr:hypothetical protein GCM10010267_61550 [Streptomyces griseorubens]